MNILFVADVFGAPGRRAVETRLPSLREELGADFCIVNGENAAAGRGITAKLADKLLASGADVDHARQLDVGPVGLRAVPLRHRPRAAAGEPLAAARRASGSRCTTASR